MKKKLSSMPDYQARMPRTPHNIGRAHAFTTAPGMIRCPYWFPVHSGDKLNFNGSLSVRLNPLIHPFLGRCKVYVDYFYVPLTVLYSPSSSLFYQTDDLVSSVFDSIQITDRFPVLDVSGSLGLLRDYGNANGQWKHEGSESLNPLVFDCSGKAAIRICEDFKFNPLPVFSDDSVRNPNCFPYALLAYHACYQLHDKFRNDAREKKSYLYNVDTHFNDDNPFKLPRLFTLNYVDAESDYFNDIKVSPIGSSVSMLSGNLSSWDILSKVNSYLYQGSGGSYSRSAVNGRLSDSDEKATSTVALEGFPSIYPQGGLNAANLRQLFMVDKLLRVVGRADKNYESQFLAHFGVKIPHDVMHNITHLGQDLALLDPTSVVSTANTYNGTSGSALGEIGGQGFVSKTFKERQFEVPFHGVFLALMYIVPEMRYQTILSRLHDLSEPMHWWQPEYDRKGMEPLFDYETFNNFSSPLSSDRVGWMFGYEYFKRSYDDVGFTFWYPSSRTSVNNYASWVLSKRPFSSVANNSFDNVHFSPNSQYEAFKVMPTDLNAVMEVPYSPSWITDLTIDNLHTLFYSDPFICDFRMNCVDVNFMSENSEPELY